LTAALKLTTKSKATQIPDLRGCPTAALLVWFSSPSSKAMMRIGSSAEVDIKCKSQQNQDAAKSKRSTFPSII
jgi:hypothetical protein